jgi:PAS domain S-box-containing protein
MKPFQLWPAEPAPEAAGPEECISILLVDDQQANLFALEALLAGEDYSLVRASSGPEALRRVLSQDFALILLDVLMPGMDGFETAELIRKRGQSGHTPIIFITAMSANENQAGQGYSLGAVDYIYKPIIPEILKAKVHVFAELHRNARKLARSEEALRLELEAHKKADLARRESEEKYRKLIARASDAIIVFDAEGETVLEVNRAALELYGYSEPEFLGLTLKDLDADPAARGKWEVMRKQTSTRFQKKADGRVFPAEVSCASVSVDGRKLIMVLTRDVTERQKAAEAELLQEREIMQRQLVATVSHELRTPIAAIKASAETLMLGEAANAKTRPRFLKIIENQADRLGGLVEGLLLVAELESGHCRPVPSAIPLAPFLKDILPGIKMLAKKKTVSISTLLEPGLVLRADRSHLTGIFQNLLDNAIKYNKKRGSIEIKARRNADGDAEVTVRDTGIGIPPADLPLIFQQFHRAPSVRELCIKGTGLGLYIIKTMVDSNGGRIWAANAEDEGTVFHFTLPLERVPHGS